MTENTSKPINSIDQSEKFLNITQKKYHNLKRKIIAIEKDNFDTIYIIPCAGNKNWHEFAENSALMYFYLVCQKLDLKTKFQVDCYSLYEQYKIGYIRTLGINKIKDNLKTVGLYQSATRFDSGIWGIKLNVALNQDTIDNFLAAETKRRTVQIVPVNSENLDPKLYQIYQSFAKRINALCSAKVDKSRSMSRILSDKMSNLTINLLVEYNEIAFMLDASNAQLMRKYQNMQDNLSSLLIGLQIISELGLWAPNICSSLSGPICEAQARIKKNLAVFSKREAKCNQ